METNNSLRLIGRAVGEPEYDHTVYGEAFFRLTVSAVRLSGAEDVLPVTVSERLLPEIGSFDGARLGVEGQIRSYNRHGEGGSRLIITAFARELFLPEDSGTDVNEVELSGHICKPVIYRTTPFSREIADIILAVNRRYGKSDYLPAIAWGRNARFAESLMPGDTVMLRGRLQSRAYQKTLPDGIIEQRTAYEISCSSIEKI